MGNAFNWLNEKIRMVFEKYFECEENKEKEISSLPVESLDWLLKPVEEFSGRKDLNEEEKIILLIALAPYLSPQTLDWFAMRNENLNRPYTEFGIEGEGCFLPTCETAAFVLSAGDLEKRLEAMAYFDPDYWLYASGILRLRRSGESPLASIRLDVSTAFLHRLCGKSEREKTFGKGKGGRLDVKEACESPCRVCGSFCCKMLHLTDFTLESLLDLDKIGYYLNFEHIEVILSQEGKCTVYYVRPCRFLNEADDTCVIHNDAEQPSICVHYSPYRCFYRGVEEDQKRIVNGNIWLNQARLKKLKELSLFGEDRRITKLPAYGDLCRVLDGIPYALEEERNVGPGREVQPMAYPCSHCSGWCCQTLVFPQQKPQNYGELDYRKYVLGFPGVEYWMTEDSWFLAVHTRCLHLEDGNRCSVYGTVDRPLFCRYFDPCKCQVKRLMNSSDRLSIIYEDYSKLCNYIRFDRSDCITAMPSLRKLKEILG